MGKHEYGGVVWGFLAPPALPAVVRPGAAHRAEHIAAKNPGADAGQSFCGHIVVDPGLATLLAVHLLPGTGVEDPVHEQGSSDPERVLQILVWSGTVAVQRDGEAVHPDY